MTDPTLTGPGARDAGSPAAETAAGSDPLLEKLRAATLGDYEILSELGRGGMATVYLAYDLSLDRKVAIKVMAPGLLHGTGMVERFKREARTAANLSHPNIIPVYAVAEAEGLLFFVMKLVQGTPLDAVTKELGQLPLPMVEAILAQVGGAIGYAHRHGVVHRDIKPGNILIDDEGWAVVTDFGIAKVKEVEGLTQSGVTVGTPTYMSPEQCSGGTITGASDQYSLGVVAFEMLAGKPPFAGPSMMALLYSHYHDAPPPLSRLRPDCPPALSEAVMRMLRKDPAERWPSLEDAVAAMGARALAHDDPTRTQLITIAKTGAIHRIVSQVQTPRSPIPLGGRATPPEVRAVPAPAGGFRWLALAAGGALALAAVALLVVLFRPAAAPNAAAVPAAGIGSEARPPVPPPAPVSVPSGTTGVVEERAATGSERGSGPAARSLAGGASARESQSAAVPRPEAPRKPGPEPLARADSEPGGQSPAPPPAPPPAPSPAPVAAPVPPPPAPVPPAAPPAAAVVPLPAAPAPDPRAAIEAVIADYARALGAGDLVEARRLFPEMPNDQRQGLESLWKSGGRMQPRWSVRDVVVEGDEATARVVGTTTVTAPRERPTDQPVNLRARLARRDPGRDWRLVALHP